MRDYDEVLDDLAAGIAGLGGRGRAALFASSARALVPAYDDWASEAGACRREAIDRAVELALAYARGRPPTDARRLLADLSAHVPPDGGSGEVDAGPALAAWWSAHAAVSVVAGRCVSTRWWLDCVLQPCLVGEAAALGDPFVPDPFDPGSALVLVDGAGTDVIDLVMATPAVGAALGFVTWAADRLAGVEVLDRPLVDDLGHRASAIARLPAGVWCRSRGGRHARWT
jgi:hypothetical protein